MEKILKIVGIKAAGRKNGNTEIILNELLKPAIEAGHEVEKIDLRRYNLKPCTGCGKCNNKELECILKDDLKTLHSKITDSDMLVLVAPCYGLTAPSILKSIVERTAAANLANIVSKSQKKYGISVSVGGGDTDWISLQRIIPSLFLSFYNCHIVGQYTIEQTALKGEVLLKPSELKKVSSLGQLLVKSGTEDKCYKSELREVENRLICPNCYSDTFHIEHSKEGIFNEKTYFKCPVCNIKVEKYEELDKILKEYDNNPQKFGISRFTAEETISHFNHIGSKINNGIVYIDEINSRMEHYLNEDVLPGNDYKAVQTKDDNIGEVQWEEDALAAFKDAVPKLLQGPVKNAIQKKAKEMGISTITKEVFLKIKKEAGF